MTTLSPNQIAFAIYWCGTSFGPQMTPNSVEHNGHIVTQIPKPGSPERTAIENWLDTAIAVCLAESGGDTEAKNSGSSAIGMWQIMQSVHADIIKDAQVYWASQRANGKTPPVTDPLVNTFCAGRLYQESQWSPWNSSRSSWDKHRGHGKAAYTFLTSPDNLKKQKQAFLGNMKDDAALTGLVSDFVHGLNPFDVAGHDWSGFMSGIFTFLKQGVLAVGIFLLGIILLLLGLWVFVSRTKAGKSIAGAAKIAIP